jgi:hypothetical protein
MELPDRHLATCCDRPRLGRRMHPCAAVPETLPVLLCDRQNRHLFGPRAVYLKGNSWSRASVHTPCTHAVASSVEHPMSRSSAARQYTPATIPTVRSSNRKNESTRCSTATAYHMPPSATVIASPFTPPAASLHRNVITCATSRGSSTRFCG